MKSMLQDRINRKVVDIANEDDRNIRGIEMFSYSIMTIQAKRIRRILYIATFILGVLIGALL